MKIFINLLLFSFGTLLLCGCGHNAVVQTKGWGLDFSWNQDSFIPNLRLGYWDVSSAVVKENVEAQLESGGNLSATSGQSKQVVSTANTPSVNAGGNVQNKIKITTGQQINGYTRDVLTSQNLKQQNVDMAKAIYGVKTVKNGESIPICLVIKSDEKTQTQTTTNQTTDKTESETSTENRDNRSGKEIKPIKITIIIEK